MTAPAPLRTAADFPASTGNRGFPAFLRRARPGRHLRCAQRDVGRPEVRLLHRAFEQQKCVLRPAPPRTRHSGAVGDPGHPVGSSARAAPGCGGGEPGAVPGAPLRREHPTSAPPTCLHSRSGPARPGLCPRGAPSPEPLLCIGSQRSDYRRPRPWPPLAVATCRPEDLPWPREETQAGGLAARTPGFGKRASRHGPQEGDQPRPQAASALGPRRREAEGGLRGLPVACGAPPASGDHVTAALRPATAERTQRRQKSMSSPWGTNWEITWTR